MSGPVCSTPFPSRPHLDELMRRFLSLPGEPAGQPFGQSVGFAAGAEVAGAVTRRAGDCGGGVVDGDGAGVDELITQTGDSFGDDVADRDVVR